MVRAAAFLILLPLVLFSGIEQGEGASSEDSIQTLRLDRLDIEAPKLPLVDPSGKATELAALAQGKNLVVHFWASWCVPCRKELPQFASMFERAAKVGVVVRAISIDTPADAAKARALFDGLKPGFPFLRVSGDPDESPGKSLWAWGLPITYFIAASGKIEARAMGTRDWNRLIAPVLSGIFQNK